MTGFVPDTLPSLHPPTASACLKKQYKCDAVTKRVMGKPRGPAFVIDKLSRSSNSSLASLDGVRILSPLDLVGVF